MPSGVTSDTFFPNDYFLIEICPLGQVQRASVTENEVSGVCKTFMKNIAPTFDCL